MSVWKITVKSSSPDESSPVSSSSCAIWSFVNVIIFTWNRNKSNREVGENGEQNEALFLMVLIAALMQRNLSDSLELCLVNRSVLKKNVISFSINYKYTANKEK